MKSGMIDRAFVVDMLLERISKLNASSPQSVEDISAARELINIKKVIEDMTPVEHDGCQDCRYEGRSEQDEPCRDCQQNYLDRWQSKDTEDTVSRAEHLKMMADYQHQLVGKDKKITWYKKRIRELEEQLTEENEPLVQINKVSYTPSNEWMLNSVPECCKKCPNHPSNGGSGICHCTLGNNIRW